MKTAGRHGDIAYLFFCVFGAFFYCGYTSAAEAAWTSPTEQTVLISEGETLNNILRTRYADREDLWPVLRMDLVRANPEVFVEQNPDLMRVGARLRLVAAGTSVHDPNHPDLVPVGFVEEASELVIAVDINRGKRAVVTGAVVYRGDTVTTGYNSSAVLLMKDKSRISLRENSTLSIDRFAYDDRDERGNTVMRLVKGGFRAVTGFIGKKDPDSYKVETPVATIGIRGTDYAVKLCERAECSEPGSGETLPSGLYTGVIDGAISLRNDAGEFVVKKGEFVRTASKGASPVPEPRGAGLVYSTAELEAAEVPQAPQNDRQKKEFSRFGDG